ILNSDGTLVAIANIPFVSTSSSMQEDAILSVATIVNIYLLIIIFSMVIGIMIANSITSPLAQIKAKMLRFKLNNKEHIYYKNNKDELGVLVEAYNHMVDDLEESSRKLAESEREEAWREMARTIAHDIKNPLTPMRLSIQHIMRMKRNDAPGWQDKLDELSKSLLEQIDILSDAAGEFLALAKSFSDNMTREDLCAMLHEQYVLFNTRDDVTIEYEHSIDEAYAMVRKSQMIRVFVNIISNAVQAVEQKEGAIVRVSITAADSNWKVAIEDNGEGVSDANVEKLFQPNFTTKSSGTGLGLMISQRVVNQANGKIYYQRSEALGGAAFIIELPMIQ
ncbi:MAG: GHKL domain-containing protein, partial [Bacteroidales bacterium]|nr:GHKL domain-containing protein [Bacteroidales bacterium]